MARYLFERTFPDGLGLAPNQQGCDIANTVICNNAEQGVTWIHSYVSADRKQTFCIYDAPTPQAIRGTAAKNGVPVGQITEVRVLDPYFHM